jgi:hypothetical protein
MEGMELQNGNSTQSIEWSLSLLPYEGNVCVIRERKAYVRLAILDRFEISDGARNFVKFNGQIGPCAAERPCQRLTSSMGASARRSGGETENATRRVLIP